MSGRARFWLVIIAFGLAMTVVVARSVAVAASDFQAATRLAQTRLLGRELREGQERLAIALSEVDRAHFVEADRELIRAGAVLSHAHVQLLALGRSSESGQVLALLEGIEVARGLIVRMSVQQFETQQAALASR